MTARLNCVGYGWDNGYNARDTTVIRMARKNLKVPENLFLALKDDKDEQESWPHYLEQQCLHEQDGPVAVTLDATERNKIAEEVAEVIVNELP